jgi:hypothetical protein
MSDDQRTKTGSTGDDDMMRPTGDAGGGPAGGIAAPSDDNGDTGTYPAEKLDLGGGTSDGDTPADSGGG